MTGARVVGFDWRNYQGALFDLDGVITPTAEIHEQAWGELFADYNYSEADYVAYIDGKPRYDGVRSFLAARGISLPEGSPTDHPGIDTICAMGNEKNHLFNRLLNRKGVVPYPGSIATLELLAEIELPAAIVSSSKNANLVLEAAGLADRFDVVVDGIVISQRRLAGKPAPDPYLFGASELGVDPAHSVVIEDAVSGVAAGAAGSFQEVIGVDRGAGAAALTEHGATLVVQDLAELLPIDPTSAANS